MKKQFTVFFILLFAFLFKLPFMNVKVANATENAIISVDRLADKTSSLLSQYKRHFMLHELAAPSKCYFRSETRNKSKLIIFKIIELIIENPFGIMFLLWILVYFYRIFHNHNIKKKYRRGKINIEQIKRSKENKNRIYIITEDDKKFYYVDKEYTLKELGFNPDKIPKEDINCFSIDEYLKLGYSEGSKIRIHNIEYALEEIIKNLNKTK
ncbi:MAG: hypothetical protein V1649_03915 [Patescibacteria group bacterium]